MSNPEANPQETREYPLAEVLTALSGVKFHASPEGHEPEMYPYDHSLHGLLGFMTGYPDGQEPDLHQLPRLSHEVTGQLLLHLKATSPDIASMLDALPPEPSIDASQEVRNHDESLALAWYEEVVQRYGDRLDDRIPVSPIPPEEHTHIPTTDEFRMMGGVVIGEPPREH